MRLLLFLSLSLAATSPAIAQTPAPPNLAWEQLAERLVSRMRLEPGERVLLLCHPGEFEDLMPHLRYAVTRAGGVDLGCLDVLTPPVPADWTEARAAEANAAAVQAFTQTLAAVDVTVMLPGAEPFHPAYAATQQLLHEARDDSRAIHFHWAGAFDLTTTAIPIDDAISRVYQRAILETDYEALVAAQRRFEQAMRDATIRVTTPAGTDIRFQMGNRPVNRQDGDASPARARRARTLIDREIELPAGAIRVAPIERTVEGVIAFPVSTWNGRPVQELRLEFSRGRIVDLEARSGLAAVRAELTAGGPAARAFREFALGFNPLLAIPEDDPWIPYYGYGAGVVRLSLGDNSELGGAVRGAYVRWNFFTDATVTVDETVWVEGGKLLR